MGSEGEARGGDTAGGKGGNRQPPKQCCMRYMRPLTGRKKQKARQRNVSETFFQPKKIESFYESEQNQTRQTKQHTDKTHSQIATRIKTANQITVGLTASLSSRRLKPGFAGIRARQTFGAPGMHLLLLLLLCDNALNYSDTSRNLNPGFASIRARQAHRAPSIGMLAAAVVVRLRVQLLGMNEGSRLQYY